MSTGLPYENASSGTRALDDIQRILTKFGVKRFGTMTDNEKGEILVQFTYRGRDISVAASINGYAAAWMKEHPWKSGRVSRVDWERRAKIQSQFSTCSILRDWIKGQITAIEVGVLTFEGAFLGQIMLPSGRTVLDEVEKGKMLPAPVDDNVHKLPAKVGST